MILWEMATSIEREPLAQRVAKLEEKLFAVMECNAQLKARQHQSGRQRRDDGANVIQSGRVPGARSNKYATCPLLDSAHR